MKIGIDGRCLMDARFSGVPEFTFNLINKLLEIDQTNTYAIYYNSLKKFNLPPFENDKSNFFTKKSRIPNKLLNYLFFKVFKNPKIDRITGADIFYLPHLNFIALKNYNKCIITIHDLSFIRYPEFFSLRKNLWHYMINVKKLVSRAGKIIAVSENTKHDLIEIFKIPSSKIEIVHSGISADYLVLDKSMSYFSEIKVKYNLPDQFILSLCTIEPRKNIEGIIKAYEIFRQENSNGIKLVITGDRGWKSKEIYRLWNNSPFKNDILFLGFVPREDKVYLYNLAKIFVFPSFYEGFGLPPVESIACGLPTIASCYSSIPEIVKNSCVLVDPMNYAEIAEAMDVLINKVHLRNLYIEKGLLAVQELSWENAAQKYLEVFNSI